MGVICVVFSSSIYFNKRVKFILFLLSLYENLFQRNVREKFQVAELGSRRREAGMQEEKERLGK
jgi:hypothetical protein